MAEMFKIKKLPDESQRQCLALAYGTDTSEDEVRQWMDQVPAGAGEPIVEEIMRLSQLGEGATKSR